MNDLFLLQTDISTFPVDVVCPNCGQLLLGFDDPSFEHICSHSAAVAFYINRSYILNAPQQPSQKLIVLGKNLQEFVFYPTPSVLICSCSKHCDRLESISHVNTCCHCQNIPLSLSFHPFFKTSPGDPLFQRAFHKRFVFLLYVYLIHF